MSTIVHFIEVGQGNMTLLELDDGKKFLYDCNVTSENEDVVLGYVAAQIGWGTNIDTFVCSHREADHIRGVKRVHKYFPIQRFWDSAAPGTTTDSSEYKEYTELRRKIGCTVVERLKRWDYGNTRLRVMNSKNDDLAANANAQSIVIKVVHRDAEQGLDLCQHYAHWRHRRSNVEDNQTILRRQRSFVLVAASEPPRIADVLRRPLR